MTGFIRLEKVIKIYAVVLDDVSYEVHFSEGKVMHLFREDGQDSTWEERLRVESFIINSSKF